MDIDIKDTIVLSDDKEYVVVSKVNHQNDTYYYLIDKNVNENIRFCIENKSRQSLIDIEDKNLIQSLLPLFVEASSKAITKEDIEIMQEINE